MYSIVVQSAGYIWVDSEVGRGTVFTICLPLAIGEDVVADEAPPLDEMAAGGSETVLVVEDEEAVRSLARRVLTNRGYTVIEAADGREALALVAAPEVSLDLVLTDVVMPELGGQELVSRLVDRHPGVRIVYMSGYTDSDKLLPAVIDPAYSFLQKPFSAESLAAKVREALDRDLVLPG